MKGIDLETVRLLPPADREGGEKSAEEREGGERGRLDLALGSAPQQIAEQEDETGGAARHEESGECIEHEHRAQRYEVRDQPAQERERRISGWVGDPQRAGGRRQLAAIDEADRAIHRGNVDGQRHRECCPGCAGYVPAQAAPQALGLGGGSSRATTSDSNAHSLCAPSQNGLSFDWPQRQSLMLVRPASSKTRPSGSTISKSPSMNSGP